MSGNPTLRHYIRTDVGRQRELNEDSSGACDLPDGSLLLVVADGMGGHAAGEVASCIAVEAIKQIFKNSPSNDPRERLRNGFLVANQRILAEATRSGASGMGTTAVAATVKPEGEVFVAHVGDSRLYHIQSGQISQVTMDHTRVQRMVQMGILAPEEAKHHPDANVVTRALGYAALADGTALEPEVREAPLALKSGDALVLCTDGLYDCVTDEEIAGTLTGRSVDEATRALIDLANERGGHDNVTVAVLYCGMERGAPFKEKERQRRVTERDLPITPGGTAAKPGPAPPSIVRSLLLVVGGLLILCVVAAAIVYNRHARRRPGAPATQTAPLLADAAPAGPSSLPASQPASAPTRDATARPDAAPRRREASHGDAKGAAASVPTRVGGSSKAKRRVGPAKGATAMRPAPARPPRKKGAAPAP